MRVREYLTALRALPAEFVDDETDVSCLCGLLKRPKMLLACHPRLKTLVWRLGSGRWVRF